MRVFEAAGSGLDNFELVNNALGLAKFTYGTGGMTVSNNNFGLGTVANTTASGLVNLSWDSQFGTTPPNFYAQANRLNITKAGACHVLGLGSSSAQVMVHFFTHAELTATKAVGASRAEGADQISGHFMVHPYSATGTFFVTS